MPVQGLSPVKLRLKASGESVVTRWHRIATDLPCHEVELTPCDSNIISLFSNCPSLPQLHLISHLESGPLTPWIVVWTRSFLSARYVNAQLLLQFTSPRLTFFLQRGGGNSGGGGRRPDRRAPPPPRAPRRDEGPRDGVRKVRISIGAIQKPSAMASTDPRGRCHILLLLLDPSVLALARHPSAPAHHSMLLEPCDIDQRRRTRTNEHETDSDLRAYRTDATKEVTSMGKDMIMK